MLDALGVGSLEELIDRAVPDTIRDHSRLDLPAPLSEAEALTWLRGLADRNQVLTSLIGQGYSNTFTPPVIQRNVLENPAWYTAYTPYQPEISQGRLEALLNFQTMVSDLTAMDMANASLLDEPTAAAEAMAMLHRVNGDKANVFFVDHECHPQTIDVVRTRAEPIGIEIVVGDPHADVPLDGVFGVLLQYPGTTGVVRDDRALVDELHERGVLVAVAADLLALVLLAPPGEWGADVVVGSAQRFGVPMGYGGPHAGFLATRDAYRRNVPGRLVGVSVDTAGRPAMRLALQTREQHIRREKATSNICTAQVLLANIAGLYAVYHGPDGLRTIAERVHSLARTLADGLPAQHDSFFDTVSVRVANADDTLARARDAGINLRKIDDVTVGIALDETTTPEIVARVREILGAPAVFETLAAPAPATPGRAAARVRHPHAPGVPHVPLRVADAALPAPARRSRPRARPHDDPARLVHHEAQRDHRDDAHHVARVREHAPVRAARPGRGLRRAVHRPRSRALRDHRLRRGVAPAQRRSARASSPACSPSASTTRAGERPPARCASSRRRRTAPTPPAR